MKAIHILSESAAVGARLRDIFYQDGFADVTLSGLGAYRECRQDEILVVYAKTNISGLMQRLSGAGGRVILLLNPDCYAMYLDRARHCGFKLLLMPAAPFVLLDAVREAIS